MNIQMTLALRYLQGRRLRTVLTTLAIVFGVMILFGLGSVIPAMSEVFRQDFLGAVGKVDLTVTNASGGTFEAGQVAALRGVEGIAQATGELRQSVTLPANLNPTSNPSNALTALTVVGLDPATAAAVHTYPIASGRFLAAGDGNTIVIPQSMADRLGLKPGDTITLPSANGTAAFTIAGIAAVTGLPGQEEVYVPLAAAQSIFNQPDRVNSMAALFTSGADRTKVESAVSAKLGSAYSLKPLDDSSNIFSSAIGIGSQAMSIIGILALVMGGFIIFNTFRTVVAERRHDLGMLRALGARRRMILGLILMETLIQGVVGTALGLVAGYGLALLAIAAINPIMESFIHRPIPMPPITISNLLLAIVMGVGITVVSGLLPARAATRVTPMEALRPAVAGVDTGSSRRRNIFAVAMIIVSLLVLVSGISGMGMLGAFLFLIGLVLIAPALVEPLARIFSRLLDVIYAREGMIARGNVTRQPGRSAVTASAVMIALAIVIAAAGLLSSVFGAFDDFGKDTLASDYLVMPSSLILSGGNVGAGPQLAQQIKDTPGVAALTTLRLAQATIDGKPLQMLGIDPVTYPQLSGLVFSSGNAQQAFKDLGAGRSVILSNIFAAQNGVKTGDTVAVETPDGPQEYKVAGIGVDLLNAKIATGYISQANLATDFHQTSDVMMMVNHAQGADAAAVRSKLQALVAAYPTFTLLDSSAFRDNLSQQFNSIGAMMYVLLFILAVPGLIAMINTLAINVIERTREIGMLRAVGSTRRQVRRMIQAESLLLAGLGTALGILAGLILGYGLVGAISIIYPATYSFPLTGVLVSIAAGIILGIIAASIPARQASKMDIIEALRYE